MNSERQYETSAEILIVDDIPENLRLLSGILEERKYIVRPANCGRLALRSATTRPPDMILLDIMMPDIDGFEVCRALKSDEKCRDVPVIFISALNETCDKVKGFTAGGIDFISKPFQSEEVIARVETHLALRRLQERLKEQNARLQLEISERRRAEESLRRSENLYRTILESTGTAITIQEEDTVITFANTGFETLSGYTVEEITDKMRWPAFVMEEDLECVRKNYAVQREISSEIRTSCEFRFIDKQRNIKNVVATVAMIPESGKSVASLIDVTELRKMKTELQRAREWESLGVFAGGISHDFSNLMAVILGNINMAEMKMGASDPIAQYYLSVAESACFQSRNLIRRLIALTDSTRSCGLTGIQRSIGKLIENAVHKALRGSDVHVRFDLAKDLPPVNCDPVQIKEMIMSLVINAREAMDQRGELEVSVGNESPVKAAIPLSQTSGCIHIRIQDHGRGIPEEISAKIFDPYFSTKERGVEKGMGLGLTMAYAVVKRHNGHIALESKVNAGTTAHIYLPTYEEEIGGST